MLVSRQGPDDSGGQVAPPVNARNGKTTGAGPIFSGASPTEVEDDLRELVAFQDEGFPLKQLSGLLRERLFPHLMRYDLPSFHAMFNSPLEDGAAHGAHVALKWNQGVTNWQVSPGGAVLEELCCQALCRLFGLGPEADATVLYSGTYANQQGLYMALHRWAEEGGSRKVSSGSEAEVHHAEGDSAGFDLAREGLARFTDPSRLAVLASADAHFSLLHAVRILGLGDRTLVSVPVDGNRRMDVAELERILLEMRDGPQPREAFCVVATAGTTSCGAVDPIADIADVCEEVLGGGAQGRGLPWLHVDGAYGLAYTLVPEWAPRFRGLSRADSVCWDPHKQMGVPIPSSILFAKDREEFRRMALFSDYWNRAGSEGPNPGVKSFPSTRPFAALPLVTSIRHQGLDGLRSRLRKPLEAIRALRTELERTEDVEVMHEPDTGILCFRVLPKGDCGAPPVDKDLDRLQERVYDTILREGRRLVSITQLGDRKVLRLVAINPETTSASMFDTVEEARKVANESV